MRADVLRRLPVGATIAAASLVVLLLSGGALAAGAAGTWHVGSGAAVTPAAGGQEHGGEPFTAENTEEVSRQAMQEPLWYSFARLLNFVFVAGVLVYYLRAPIAGYLARRSTEIRADLTKAAETREAAAAQLASVEQKMQALPGEIEALKARGLQEIAAEEARIRATADAERQRLLEQARREIDLQVRAAERELVKRAADLTIGLASDRITRTITDEDRARLVDRYLADLGRRT